MSTPLNFLQASVRADELVARQNIGIGTDSQSSELHIKASAPEIRLEDRVGAEASETATRIYADSGNTYIQSGVNFTDGSSSNIVFGSMGNVTEFVNIGAHGIETTGNLFVNNLQFTQTQGLDQILNVSNTTSNIMTLTNTSDDALNVAGGMTLGSNLAVNTDDLFVDTQTGRVGIGTNNPSVQLKIYGTSSVSLTTANGPSYAQYGQLVITDSTAPSGTSTLGNLKIGYDASTGSFGTGFLQCVNPNVYTGPLCIQPYGGNVGIGITNPPENLTVQDSVISPTFGLRRGSYSDYVVYMKNTSGSFSTVNTSDDTVLNVGKGSGTDRSINALGTINASGTDYAEYMKKSISNLDIKKGDIIGINNDGELTNVFSESIQFVVKSTNPSYVGGDSWNQGTINAPKYPSVMLRVDEYSNISSQDANLYTYWEEQNLYANTEQLNVYYEENEKYLEDRNLHRDPYDRIAFCGQVPVNVYNATPGQYVIPKQTDDDTISYELTNTPTFEQYQISIGKVIKIQEDGRAFIIVKIS